MKTVIESWFRSVWLVQRERGRTRGRLTLQTLATQSTPAIPIA
jgi:hypothetical protein